MSLELERIRCTRCGGEFSEYDPDALVMRCDRIGCGATFRIKQAKEFAKIEVDHETDIRNLRLMMFEAVKWSLGLTEAPVEPHAMRAPEAAAQRRTGVSHRRHRRRHPRRGVDAGPRRRHRTAGTPQRHTRGRRSGGGVSRADGRRAGIVAHRRGPLGAHRTGRRTRPAVDGADAGPLRQVPRTRGANLVVLTDNRARVVGQRPQRTALT